MAFCVEKLNPSRILGRLGLAYLTCLIASSQAFSATGDFETCRQALEALAGKNVKTEFANSQPDEIRDTIGQLDSHVEAVKGQRFQGRKKLLEAAQFVRQALSNLLGLARFSDVESAKVLQPEYFDPKFTEDGTSIENYLRLSLGDPILGPRLQAEIRASGADPENPSPKELLLASMKDPDLRRAVARISRETLAQKEAKEAERVAEGNRAVDVLFIGAGLHEATDQNYLRQLAPDIDTITIEGSNDVGSTFAQGGKAVSLNSSSKKPDRQNYRQRLGEGDLNYLPGGLVQVHQFDNSANPDQVSLAQALVVNRSFGNPILFNRRVTDVSDNPNSAKDGYEHIVTLSDGSKIKARYVVNFGLGKERVPDLPGLRDAFARAKEAAKQNPNLIPGIQTYGEFFRFINGSQNPYSPFSGKRVAVIGPGDSGKAVVRWLLRTNVVNPESYGRDSSDVPGPKLIPWYGQECQTCEVFFSSNRSFYNDITKGYRNKTLVARDKLVSVEERDGKYILRDALGQEEEVDHIIVTAGFESQVPDLFPSLLGARKGEKDVPYQENPSVFSNVNGFEPSLGQPGNPAPVILARRLLREDGSPSNVILSGPSAGRIVSAEELKEIEENFVANANHNWRVWRTMDAIAKDVRERRGKASGNEATGSQPLKPQIRVAKNGDVEKIYGLNTADGVRRNGGQIGDGTALANRVYDKLLAFDLSGTPRVSLVIANTGDGFQLRFEPPLAKDQAETLALSFQGDKELLGLVESAIGSGRNAKTLRLEFALENGRLATSGSSVDIERTPDPQVSKAAIAQAEELRNKRSALTALEVEGVRDRYRRNQRDYNRPYRGEAGYARMAKEVFNGDLAETYDRMEEIVGEAGIKNLGWSRIPPRNGPKLPPPDLAARAKTKELNDLRAVLFTSVGPQASPVSRYSGVEGQLRWAEDKYQGDTAFAYRDVSAKLSPQETASLGWNPQLQIPVRKAREILGELPSDGFFSKNGFRTKYRGGAGLKRVATEYFDGDTVSALTTVKALFGEKFSGLDW